MKYTAAVTTYISNITASGKTAATISSYSATLDRFGAFLTEQGIENIEAVRPLTVAAYMEKRAGEISATSLNLELTHVRCFFGYMEDMEVIDHSPVKKSIAVSKSALREQRGKEYDGIISKKEVISLLSNDHPANTHKAQINRNRALLMVFLTTGLRNESIREMKIGDIDFENSKIKVNEAKGGKRGYAPLCDVTASLVREYLNDHPELTADDYLFGFSRDGKWMPFSRQQMSNTVEAAIKSYLPERTGIRSHALRHSFASLVSAGGLSDGEVSLLLFHSDGTGAAVTRRYISDDLTGLFGKVNTIFNRIVAKAV